ACLVADALGMTRVLVHPHAGVLSAYGMGLADLGAHRDLPVDAPLDDALVDTLDKQLAPLVDAAVAELAAQGCAETDMQQRRQLHLKYAGTDTALAVDLADATTLRAAF